MNTHIQFIRYATIGLVSNLALFLAYLGMTQLGAGPKSSMTFLYITGVCLTFFFNRNWTFKHNGHIPKTFINYLLIYALGYLIQLAGLYIFVDRLGYKHEFIMATLIITVAIILFILQKTFVFRHEASLKKSSEL